MKQKSQITTFYIETLILVAVMIGILLVLTQIVGISRRESTQAKRLTEAVTIAQSAAEAAAAGEELSELEELLSLGEFTVTEAAGEETAEGIYRWQRENGRTQAYRLTVTRTRGESQVEDIIGVYTIDGEEPVYTLTVRRFEAGEEDAV